ncbi:MAG: hypothetical protein AAGJ94_00465 [Pseudomonadota bacterium]
MLQRLVASHCHRAELIDSLSPKYVIADRTYDAEHFQDAIGDPGATEVSRHDRTVGNPVAAPGRSSKSAT